MTPHDEHALYLRDKHAWARYVAPKWARMLAKAEFSMKNRVMRFLFPIGRAMGRKLFLWPGAGPHCAKRLTG